MQDIIAAVDTLVVADTLNAVVNAIPVDQQVEFYKELLASQKSTYDLFVFILLGILTVFVGGTLIYNIKTAKKDVKKHTEKILNKQKEIIIKKIRKDFEDELNSMKGDSARMFANMSKGEGTAWDLVTTISWWGDAVMRYSLCSDRGNMLNISVDALLEDIQKANNVKKEFKRNYLKIHDDYEDLKTNIDQIPDLLYDKKKEIKAWLSEIENAVPPDPADIEVAPPGAEPED